MATDAPHTSASSSGGTEDRSGDRPVPVGLGNDTFVRVKWTLNAARVDRERILRGLTQHELAGAAFVDPGTLSDLLNGRRRPQLGTIGAIAKALELAIPDLVDFD